VLRGAGLLGARDTSESRRSTHSSTTLRLDGRRIEGQHARKFGAGRALSTEKFLEVDLRDETQIGESKSNVSSQRCDCMRKTRMSQPERRVGFF
jgi:hypothetical protein